MIPGSYSLTNGVATVHVAPQNLRIYFSEEATKAREAVAAGHIKGDEFVKVMEQNILACARRNHPELTLDQLRDVLDTADIEKVHAFTMTKSGLQAGPLAGAGGASPSPAPSSSDTSSMQPAGSPTTSSTG